MIYILHYTYIFSISIGEIPIKFRDDRKTYKNSNVSNVESHK